VPLTSSRVSGRDSLVNIESLAIDSHLPTNDVSHERTALKTTIRKHHSINMSEPAANAPPPPSEPPVEAGEDGASTSKKAAKKAEAKAKKEAEKARRAAERAATTGASSSAAATEDLATDNYGNETAETKFSADAVDIHLKTLGEEHVGKLVQLRGWIQNSRMQGAKMVFVEIREEGNWAIQGIAAANPEGTPVSRQMAKWIGAVNLESFVIVEGTIQKPLEDVKSCRVSKYELHILKFFIHAAAPAALGLTLAAANRPIANFSDEEVPVEEGVEKLSLAPGAEPAGIPAATMLTHLDNISMYFYPLGLYPTVANAARSKA